MIHEEVYNVLQDIGIPMHLDGFDYIAYAVEYLRTRLHEKPSMTQTLYPKIAEAFGSSDSRVERAIRNAVTATLSHIDPKLLYKYFGNSVNYKKPAASNSQFLYTLAYHVSRRLTIMVEMAQDA